MAFISNEEVPRCDLTFNANLECIGNGLKNKQYLMSCIQLKNISILCKQFNLSGILEKDPLNRPTGVCQNFWSDVFIAQHLLQIVHWITFSVQQNCNLHQTVKKCIKITAKELHKVFCLCMAIMSVSSLFRSFINYTLKS